MDERHNELGAVLAGVRRRWTRRTRLAAWAVGALAAAMVLAVGMLAVWLIAAQGLPLAIVALVVTLMALVTIACAAWPIRRPPSDRQLARYIEEQAGGLDDVVVTAVAHEATGTPVASHLAAQAAEAIERAGAERLLVPRETIRRAAIHAAAATVVLAAAAAWFAPTASRGASIAAAYLFPSRITFDVTPGTAKVRADEPVTITARIRGVDPGLVPVLEAGDGDAVASAPMTATGAEGEYTITLDRVSESFPYRVIAGPARSDDYAIEVIRPARVTRVDLRYRYPRALGLEPRTEEDGGDIYGPKGTTVEIVVTTDKPIAAGSIALADGHALALDGGEMSRTASLDITGDGSYRIALTDVDGLENPGETEYFIRMLNDRPPDVRVLRPGGDRQVTPIEEVLIEARADDDFGLASFDLVFQASGREDTVVPFPADRQLAVSASHMVHLEDLGVQPGEFVTYYVRARDVGQGRRGTEARSDIYFLEVKPFEEVFVAAQSQANMQGGGPGLMELVDAQKEIIAATWKLDARARRGGDARSEADIKAVGKAQAALGARAAEAAGTLAGAMRDPRRRRPRPGMLTVPGGEDPMARAVEAMGRAAGELDRARTAPALPHEMEALEQLLKADADVKRRQVARQQAGGGSGSNRETPDLSTLFDQQLRKQQQTNYETPDSAETREEPEQEDDPLEQIRELARRQEGLTREQQDLARNRERLSAEEIARQLERLTREQQQLTEQADELSRQMQQASRQASNDQEQAEPSGRQSSSASGSEGQSGSSGAQSSSGRQLREIAEQMKNAAGDLRRQDPQRASARSGEAVEQLRDLSRQMERASPDERRRAMGDLQFEARQIADAERRIANEAERAAAGPGGEDARRRLSAEQERLADRTERLADSAREMAAQPSGGETGAAETRRAAEDAARALESERLAERMREAAGALRQPQPDGRAAEQGREMARALDCVAGTLGAASGARDEETERLSEQLARTGELRDRVSELQRTLQELEQEARQGQQGGRPESDRQGQPSPGQSGQPSSESASAARQGSQGREGASGEQGGADGGRAGHVARLQREAAEQAREAQRLARELGQENPEMKEGGQTPEDWWPSVSAPGTEAFKQDFSKWESLKKNLLVALERTETRLSGQLRDRETRQRLNAGGHEGVAESYREMVDRYYQSLATPRRPR